MREEERWGRETVRMHFESGGQSNDKKNPSDLYNVINKFVFCLSHISHFILIRVFAKTLNDSNNNKESKKKEKKKKLT